MKHKTCISCGRWGKNYVFAEDGWEKSITLCVYCSSDKGIDKKASAYAEHRREVQEKERIQQEILSSESRKITRILQGQVS